MDTLLNISSSLLLLIGSFLCFTGGLGILRFPDFYTRMHAVGVTDTLATAMILIGLILHNPDFLVDVKLLIILLMTIFLSPTASHALANAARYDELSMQKDSKSNSESPSSNP
jgi:multicomponent Na+:H+ antiporter subunit G